MTNDETYKESSVDSLRSIWAGPTFLGQRAAQTWSDFYNWERFFEAFPVRSVIELGTWTGGFALFLLLQTLQRNAQFLTFDTAPAPACDSLVAKALGLKLHCRTVDIFAQDGKAVAQAMAQLPKPLLLFCDNGDKPREFQLFTPMLQPGDFVAVHDWGTEFNPPDVVPVAHLVEPVFLNESVAVGTLTRWYRRI
jgi:cephalosporin hydroxylase